MTGWVAVQVQLVGSLDRPAWSHYWDRTVQTSRAMAISHGFSKFGHDDFNVGEVRDGKLTWWGWMDEPLTEDLASTAAALGLQS